MTSILEKHDKPFEYAAIVMNLIIAYQFLKLWYMPQFSDVAHLFSMAMLMAFEFIMVHSGVFMAVMPKKISLFLLVPIYALFAFAFFKATENNTILIVYGLVVLNRMRFAFSEVSAYLKKRAILISILAALSYFVLIFVCLFTNGIFGELALTQEFLNTSGYFNHTKGSGVFVETPHIAISFGFFYHSLLAIIEALLLNSS
jgi:hypothetical protein